MVRSNPQQALFAPEGGQQRITDSHLFALCSNLTKGQAKGIELSK